MTHTIESFYYRLAHPGYNVFPGAHPGQMVGSGQLFKRHEPLLASPDPRRIDLRASLLDPFNGYRVRVFQQHSKLTVYVIADLSASMSGRLPMLADFLLSAAQSALHLGDSFGFIGCGSSFDKRWLLPAGPAMEPVREMSRRLTSLKASGTADSLERIAPLLPKRRSLLFLVSDCHFSLTRLRKILQPLTSHAVVPLVCWDAAEYQDLPEWGLVRFQDAESRRAGTWLMRPDLKQRVLQNFAQGRIALTHTFRSFGMEPMFLSGAYRAESMTQYFQQHTL